MSRSHSNNQARLFVSSCAVLAMVMAAPAGADVVYSWTTEQGTQAFTDDSEKIPSRYAKQAKQQTLESLRSYPRLTIEASRRETAQKPSTVPAHRAPETAQTEESGLSVLVGGTRFGANATVVPVGRGGDEAAPTLIESHRIQPRDSMATSHETVISQGGRVISIRRDALSQTDSTALVPPVR